MCASRENRRSLIAAAVDAAALIAAETLWPTRCAVCDRPGAVLCERCKRALPYVDQWRACAKCGEPYGYVQCCACSATSLARAGREELPFSACASATMFEGAPGRIVRVYKDAGERRLAEDMATAMARIVPAAWEFDAVTFIPATAAALRTRGFDHAQLLADQLSAKLGVQSVSLFNRPKTSDQRALGGFERIQNLAGSFSLLPDNRVLRLPRKLLLVDDVFTTGATLCAATDALLAADVYAVYGLTFARV